MNNPNSGNAELYEVPAARAPLTVLSVERAMGEFRRGRPVVVKGGGGHAVLALAAEAMSSESLQQLQDTTGSAPALAITARRAAVLGLADSAGKIAIVSGLGGLGADEISALANPLVEAGVTPELRERLHVTVRNDPGHDCASAAVALSKIARLLPAAVTAQIDDVDDVISWANRHDFLSVDTGDVFQFESAAVRNLKRVGEARVPISDAHDTRIVAFRPADGGREHLAIIVGQPDPAHPVLVRLHSECFTGDLLGSLRCDCGDQLQGALSEIKSAGTGILLYLAQEGRGIGLINKLRAYELQDLGFDTMDANEQLGFDADERVYMPAARMLKLLGFQKVRLMTNNPDKLSALSRYGVNVVERVQHAFPANKHNEFYLQTKASRAGHQF
ncbi:GTP cyclohydrolase II [Thalassospiraceae bacterium LMO-JJ14]|nr:GTP cyclohydrolase II [Thalassospiraceae bacterium LMO-JJ14]